MDDAHLKMARGPACRAEPLMALRYQPACKPGFVGHRRLAPAIRDGHSSGTPLARGLEQPTRTASLTSLPRALSLARTSRVAAPIRSCSRCGLPCRFRYRTRGALLPHLFTLTRLRSSGAASPCGPAAPRPPEGGEGGRFVLCGTVPGVAPAGCYPAPHVDGARTFLPSHLSVIAGAAVRPTDHTSHGGSVPRRQASKASAVAGNIMEGALRKTGLNWITNRPAADRLVAPGTSRSRNPSGKPESDPVASQPWVNLAPAPRLPKQ